MRLHVLLVPMALTAGCDALLRNGPEETEARGYVEEIRTRMKTGDATSAKCAGARTYGANTKVRDATRAEIGRLCSYEAPLASLEGAVAYAEKAQKTGQFAAAACAEGRLNLEDLASHRAEPDIAALAAKHHALCDGG